MRGLLKLIYIGQAIDANKRIITHEKMPNWKQYINYGEVLCYNFAPLQELYLDRGEAAIIYKHKPPGNIEYKNRFEYPMTTINITGTHSKLYP